MHIKIWPFSHSLIIHYTKLFSFEVFVWKTNLTLLYKIDIEVFQQKIMFRTQLTTPTIKRLQVYSTLPIRHVLNRRSFYFVSCTTSLFGLLGFLDSIHKHEISNPVMIGVVSSISTGSNFIFTETF